MLNVYGCSSSCGLEAATGLCEARAARRRRALEKTHGAGGFLGKNPEPSRRAYIWVLTGAQTEGRKLAAGRVIGNSRASIFPFTHAFIKRHCPAATGHQSYTTLP